MTQQQHEPTKSPAPIRGWLLVFVVWVLSGVCAGIGYIVRDSYRALLFIHSKSAVSQVLRVFVIERLALRWLLLLVAVAGITLVLDRSKSSRQYWMKALPLLAGIQTAAIVVSLLEHRSVVSNPAFTPAEASTLPFMGPMTLAAAVLGVQITLVWWAYWRSSSRVVATFRVRASDDPQAHFF